MVLALRSQLPTWNLHGQRIILRADLNVPLDTQARDHKLIALAPTMDLLLNKGAHIVIVTHLGRPRDQKPRLSTKNLIPLFEQHGYKVTYAPTLEAAHNTTATSITLLENVRFFPGEKDGNATFAQELAALGDYYVNDAFGVTHRQDTSVTLVPKLFPPERRTIGLLIERELTILNKLTKSPQKPFVVIVGGGKVSDKLPLIEALMPQTTHILFCPALSFTIAQAHGAQTGKSLVDPTFFDRARSFIINARSQGVTVELPVDYQIAQDTMQGPLSCVDAASFPLTGIGLSIGPRTIARYVTIINQAKTVFFNGVAGIPQRPETLEGSTALLKAMSTVSGCTVVGGGDSVALARAAGLENKITYLSTGGGATLHYLAEKELPGLVV